MDISPLGLIAIPVLLFAITVHEASHGLVAYWGGDDTASLMGRVTLNPIPHIDPIGTVLMPIVGLLTGLPLIGWAKPVPVNPLRFRRAIWGVYVAMAGPGSNLLTAIVFTIVLAVLRGAFPESYPYALYSGVEYSILNVMLTMCCLGIIINVALMLFNLIPLPPLDGHWVVDHFFLRPGNLIDQFYTAIQPFSYMVLILIIVVLPFGKIIFAIANLFFFFVPGLSL